MPNEDRQQLLIELTAKADQLERELAIVTGILEDVGEAAEQAGARGDFRQTETEAAQLGDQLEFLVDGFRDLEGEQRKTLKGIQDAGGDAGRRLNELGQNVETVERSLRQVDRLKALPNLEREAKEAGKEIKAARDFAAGLSKETKQAGEQGSEAARRIATAFENAGRRIEELGQDARIAEGLLEDLGESPRENLAAANTETERALILLGQLANVTKRLDEEAGEGLGSFADNAAKGRQTIRQLTDSVERLGDDASPVLRRELARLERQFGETFERGRHEVVELERELETLEADLRAGQTGFFDLSDGLRTLQRDFPRLTKVIGGSVAALGAFTTAYRGTREAIDQIREATGVDLDAPFRAFFDDFIEAAARTEDITTATEELTNQRRILIALGRDFVNTEYGIALAFREVTEEMRLQREAADQVQKVLDQIRGFDAAAVRDRVKQLTEAFGRLSQGLRTDPDLAAALREELDKLATQADRLGSEIDRGTVEALERMRAKVEELDLPSIRRAWEDLGVASAEALDRQADRLLTLADYYTGYRRDWVGAAEVTSEQAEIIVAEIDTILDSIAQLPIEQRRARAQQVEELELVKAALSGLTEAGKDAAAELRASFEEAAGGIGDALGETFRDVLDQLDQLRQDAAGGIDTGDAGSRSLGELEEQLRQLQDRRRELESAGPLELLESDELLELPGEIAEVEDQIRKLRDESAVLFQETADSSGVLSGALKDLVIGNEEFRDAFKQLPPASREAVERLIENYSFLGETTTDQQGLVKALATELEGAFRGAGIEVESLSSLVRDLEAPTQTLSEALDELAKEATAEGLRNGAAAAEELREQWILLEPASKDTVRSLSDVGEEGDSVEEKLRKLGGNIIRRGDDFVRLASTAGSAATETGRVGDEAERTDRSLTSAGEGAGRLAVGAEAAAVQLGATREAAEGVAEPLQQVTESARALGDSETTGALDALLTKLRDLDASAEGIAINVGAILRDLRELAGLDFEELRRRLGEVGEAADEALG